MRPPSVPRYSAAAGVAFLGDDDVDPEAINEEDSLVGGGDSNSVVSPVPPKPTHSAHTQIIS